MIFCFFSLANVVAMISSDHLSKERDATPFFVQLFRYLRNAAAIKENQNLLSNDPLLLTKVHAIFQKLKNIPDTAMLTKVILQFLVNLIVSNKQLSSKVSNIFYDDILDCFCQRNNDYEVLALLYNLHLRNRDLIFREILCEKVLALLGENDSEYAQFLAELFLYSAHFWSFFDNLELSSRIDLLELLKTRWIERKLGDIPDISLKVLSEQFWKSENVIFQTVTSTDRSMEPYEVSLLLDILGSLCGNDKYLALLQKDKDLIIRCGVLLINIHRLGKQSENYFSSVQKLAELKEPSEAIQKHPAFGFKVGLVRLVGNLCWKNKKMQDLVSY